MTLHRRTMKVKRRESSSVSFCSIGRTARVDLVRDGARALTEPTQVCLRYMLRAERHPEDPNKKAGEE